MTLALVAAGGTLTMDKPTNAAPGSALAPRIPKRGGDPRGVQS